MLLDSGFALLFFLKKQTGCSCEDLSPFVLPPQVDRLESPCFFSTSLNVKLFSCC